MALVKYGGGITAMSGSIAGNTFARNRYCNYVRARTKPVNPRSYDQGRIRNAMSYLTTYWAQTLIDTERIAWNLYGSSVSMLNKLGEATFLSGYNQFLRSNVILKRIGIAPVKAGPTIFELPEAAAPFTVAGDASDHKLTVGFDNTAEWANEVGGYLHIFQGTPQNTQRNFFAGPWRILDSIIGAVIPPATPYVNTSPTFPLAEGQKVWIYGRIQRADGRLSQPFRASCTVSA